MTAQSSAQAVEPVTTTPASVASTQSGAMPSTAPANASGATRSGATHIIQSGESLYTIARQYNVTTDSIVHANNLGSPDRIEVGQLIRIPGAAQSSNQPRMAAVPTTSVESPVPSAPAPVQQQAPETAVNAEPVTPAAPLDREIRTSSTRPAQQSAPAAQTSAPDQTPVAPSAPSSTDVSTAPTAQTAVPQQTAPATSASAFRMPVSGQIITSFAASRTGINISASEGSAVRAAGAGEVIYVGNAVQGYGNLILIRHENGYVSAYAHLKDVTVSKGARVNAGDAIGSVGTTGGVDSPQLHFELREGATPVDPMPMFG